MKHIGPTAQGFYAVFGLGNDDRTLSTIDPAGIALVAIQELVRHNQQLKQQNEELAKRVEALELR